MIGLNKTNNTTASIIIILINSSHHKIIKVNSKKKKKNVKKKEINTFVSYPMVNFCSFKPNLNLDSTFVTPHVCD